MEVVLGIGIIFVLYLIIKQEKTRARAKRAAMSEQDIYSTETAQGNIRPTQDGIESSHNSKLTNPPSTTNNHDQNVSQTLDKSGSSTFKTRIEKSKPKQYPKESKAQAFHSRREHFAGKSSTSDSEGLATFTISFGREEEESNNKNKAQWIKPGTAIKVKDKTVTGGFFYLGGKLQALDGYGVDAALIDDKLFIRSEPMSYLDETLGYWPIVLLYLSRV